MLIINKPLSIVLIVILSVSCVDPFEVNTSDVGGQVVIEGSISDKPGPYQVRVSRSFDVQSKTSFIQPVSVNKITMYDDSGVSAIMQEVKPGIYETDPLAIKGEVGRAYSIKVELRDGRIYQSIPDTISATGNVENIYSAYREFPVELGTEHGLDISFNATRSNSEKNRFLWKSTATFKYDTNPELYDTLCAEGRCPKPLPCSGYRVDQSTNELLQTRPCNCCTCWANIFNIAPIVSEQFASDGVFKNVFAMYLPIDPWLFSYYVNIEISQLSLSEQAYRFWRGVKHQADAKQSLFIPVTGVITSNFIQLSGKEEVVSGLFYATAITSKSIEISAADLVEHYIVPPKDFPIKNSCLKAFANATTTRPEFWHE